MTTQILTDRLESSFAIFPESVDKFPLSGPDNAPTPWYGLFTNEGDSVGAAVKRGYSPHTLDDVRALTESALSVFNADDSAISTSWNDGHRVTVGPTREQRRNIYGTQDAIFPRFNLRAGYDGNAFTVSLGYFRDACQNLAMLQAADGARLSISIRHTSGLREKMDTLTADFSRLLGNWDSLADTAAQLQERELVVADYLAEVFPAVSDNNDRKRKTAVNQVADVCRRIARERQQFGVASGDLKSATAWELYNGVQGYVQHTARRRNAPSDFERALLAANDARVKTAMSLALAS